MKKLLLGIYCMLLISLSHIAAQTTGCTPLKIRVVVDSATCFDDGIVTIFLLDVNGNIVDTNNLANLSHFMFNVSLVHDTTSIALTGSNIITLPTGFYYVGVRAICNTGVEGINQFVPVSSIDTMIQITTKYKVLNPTLLSSISQSQEQAGKIPSLSCAKTGRFQFHISQGAFPYKLMAINETLHDTIRTTFTSPMYTGEDSSHFDYKYYYTLDSLGAGKYSFHWTDGCNTTITITEKTLEETNPPIVNNISWYYGDSLFQNDNVLRFRFSYTNENGNYLPMLSEIWKYRVTFNGSSSQWKPVVLGTIYDTIPGTTKYCDVFGDSILFEVQSDQCIYQNFEKIKIIDKPRAEAFISTISMATDTTIVSNERVYDSCGYFVSSTTQMRHTKSHNFTYKIDSGTPINNDTLSGNSDYNFYYTAPLTWVYYDTDSNKVITSHTIGSNIATTSRLTESNIIDFYHITDPMHVNITVPLRAQLVDANDCELYSINKSAMFVRDTITTGGAYINSYWESLFSSDTNDFCANKDRTITVRKRFSVAFCDSTYINLITSPLNNKYNFQAFYTEATNAWVFTIDTTINDARVFWNSGVDKNQSVSISSKSLSSGIYKFEITDPCKTDTITLNAKFPDQYSWEMNKPKFNFTNTCSGMKITPLEGSYLCTKSNIDSTNNQIFDSTTTEHAYFQIIDGPIGGYLNTVSTLNDEMEVSGKGYYTLRMYRYNEGTADYLKYCEPEFYDTIFYYSGIIMDFKYAYAYTCDHASTHVHAKIEGSLSPYQYILYENNAYDSILAINNTGDFNITHATSVGHSFGLKVVNQCQDTIQLSVYVQSLEAVNKAWFEHYQESLSICEGSQVKIYSLNWGDSWTYQWNGPNGFNSTEQNLTINTDFSSANVGWYKVQINGTGCVSSFRDSIYLHLYELPSVTITPTDTVCPGEVVPIKFIPHGFGNITYKIGESNYTSTSFTTYTGIDSAVNSRPFMPKSDTYFWVDSVYDERCANNLNKDSIFITLRTVVTDKSKITTIDDLVCYGDTAILQASSSLSYPQYYTWYNSDFSVILSHDTLDGTKTISNLVLPNQITDNVYYVTVGDDSNCPLSPTSNNAITEVPYLLFNTASNGKTTSFSSTQREMLRFYDAGWVTSRPSNGVKFTHTFSSFGKTISIRFYDFYLSPDLTTYFRIYDGKTEDPSKLIAEYRGNQVANCPFTIQSVDTALTVVAYTASTSGTHRGWNADVANYPLAESVVVMDELSNHQTTTLVTDEHVRFFDPGGAGGAYGHNRNITHTFSALSGTLQVKFNAFYTQSLTTDYLEVYDSDTINAEKLLGTIGGSYSKGALIPSYQSTGKNLTFRFISNATNHYNGWDADIIQNSSDSLHKQVAVKVNPVFDTIVEESTCQSTVPYNSVLSGINNIDVSVAGTLTRDTVRFSIHGCDSTVHLILHVRELPHISASDTINNDTISVCMGNTLQLMASPDSVSYLWQFHSDSTSFHPFFDLQENNQTIFAFTGVNYTNEGWYHLTVTQEGCIAEDSIYLSVKQNIGMPKATISFISDTLILKDTVDADINRLQHSHHLKLKIDKIMSGENSFGCSPQYRLYLAGSVGFTDWKVCPSDSLVIPNEDIFVGYTTIQFRYDPGCANLCGVPGIREYKYFIGTADSAVHITPVINESPICREQDSVYLNDIYLLGFNSHNSKYQYRYEYYAKDSLQSYCVGPNSVSDSVWMDLTIIDQIMDTIVIEGVKVPILSPATDKISVKESPCGNVLDDYDIIRISVRSITIQSTSGTDTTWAQVSKSTIEWVIAPSPTFATTLFDYNTNQATSLLPDVIRLIVNSGVDAYMDTIAWYWSSMPSTPDTLIDYNTMPGLTSHFRYDKVSGVPVNSYHNNLTLYDFAYASDTIAVVAAMHSKLLSCPIKYDTAFVFVKDNAHISKISGDSVQAVCQYSPIVPVLYKITGTADSARIQWSPSTPTGITFVAGDGKAQITGSPSQIGVFSYNIIAIQNYRAGASRMDTAIGQITVYPVYDYSTSTPETIISCHDHYMIGDSVFTHNVLTDITLHTIHGCDSMVSKEIFINHPANPDYVFTIECPDDIYDTLRNGNCAISLSVGTASWKHHIVEKIPAFAATIMVNNNAPVEFTAGTHTITWTATDSCGNTATCEQMVYIAYPPCPKAVDYDSNVYQAVRIDCDCWTQTNLKSQHYSDGSVIENVYSYQSELYPDVVDNVNKFGHLYTWYAAMDTAKGLAENVYGHIQGICPAGWYLPPIEKYESIARYGTSALKSPLYWLDGGGTNETGFSALPAGLYNGAINRYENLMGNAYFWSTTFLPGQNYAHAGVINYNCEDLLTPSSYKGMGYSIRCIKERE